MKPLPLLCALLLDAGQLADQISSKYCINHSTISIIDSMYFPYPYKPCGSCPSKLSSADTHYVQQLISSWKAGNWAHISKTLVDIKNQLSHHTMLILTCSKQVYSLRQQRKVISQHVASGEWQEFSVTHQTWLSTSRNWWECHMGPTLTTLGQIVVVLFRVWCVTENSCHSSDATCWDMTFLCWLRL